MEDFYVLTWGPLNSTPFFPLYTFVRFFESVVWFINNKVLQGFMTLLALLVSVGRDFISVKHCQDFFFVFSAPLPTCLKKPVFSKLDLLRGRYQPDCTGIFWPDEGTSQPVLGSFDQMKVPASLPVTISKKWKNPRFYVGKWPEYRPFRDLRPTWPTGGLGHRSQIVEGPVLRNFSYA